MHYETLARIIHADRDREIEAAIRRRQLLKPDDEPNKCASTSPRITEERRFIRGGLSRGAIE